MMQLEPSVTSWRTRCKRRGFTLFELIASLIAASLLMMGLGSSVYIAAQAVDVSRSPQVKVLESHRLLMDLASDLQFATEITEADDNVIAVTIPDRNDADTAPDTVRYAWQGADLPLTRQYNGGDVIVVAESVHDFDLGYCLTDGKYEHVMVTLEMIDDTSTKMLSSIPLVNRP